jgi:hypothetical protein
MERATKVRIATLAHNIRPTSTELDWVEVEVPKGMSVAANIVAEVVENR